MLVFRYDKSFEGLLTAIFDAYTRRTFPEQLIGPGEPLPMFASELFDVLTDTQKAERVWRGLGKKLRREGCNLLTHVWLSETAGCDDLLLRYIRKVFDSSGDVSTDFADRDILEARNIALKVSREAEHLRQFVRFRKAADGTFYAPVSPIYNALPLAIPYFRDRFADQRWLIYDLKRQYGYYYDGQKAREIAFADGETPPGDELTEEQMDADERQFQTLWKAYFDSMAIQERINPQLQRRQMPRRFWKYLPEFNF